MNNDVIIMPKRIFRSPAWHNAACWRLLCWCLANASATARTVRTNGVPVHIGAGWLAADWATLGEETGLGGAPLREALAKVRALGLIEVVLAPWAVRIQIVNWQEYTQEIPLQ